MTTHDTTYIPEGWRETIAEEYCFKVADGTHDSPKQSEEGKYLVTSKNLKDGRLDLSSSYKISLPDFELVNKRSKVDKGDILVGMIGTVGEVCLIKDEPDFAIKNVGLFKCGDYDKSVFLYYFLRSNQGQEYILSRLSGTTQKYITLGDLRKFPIIHPIDLSEQRAIADILSSFDAKIELLREQNETLEKTAQTIFQEWFGRYSVDCPEELPEGWKIGKLKEIGELQGGFVHDTSVNGKTRVLISKMGVVNGKDWFNRNSVIEYSGFIPEKHRLNEDDLIICTRDVTQDRVVIGNVAMAPKDLTEFGLYAGSNTWIFKSEYNKYYLFLILRSQQFRDHIIQSAKGSTIVMITKDAFLEREIIIPTSEFLNHLMTSISPFFDKIKNNNSQIQSLSKTRDELLPRLMKGEIRIKCS